jgi:hypothetical protein
VICTTPYDKHTWPNIVQYIIKRLHLEDSNARAVTVVVETPYRVT